MIFGECGILMYDEECMEELTFDDINMDALYSYQDAFPDSWIDNVHQYFGDGLTTEMIVQSVQEASDFFNMDTPMNIHEDWTTGVMTGMPFTESDDVLVFNRQQMQDMGITDKEGFDLVMTHEGTHRALQGLDTGYDSHQEELCCDYMAGVRAGLNGMDEDKMQASLADSVECETHPDGMARVQAIENGVSFAHDYMDTHGVAPTFSDCLKHFEELYDISQDAPEQINLRSEGDETLHAYSQSEINSHICRAEAEMRRAEANMRHNETLIKSRSRMGEPHSFEDSQYNNAKRAYDSAKSEYYKWKGTKADS